MFGLDYKRLVHRDPDIAWYITSDAALKQPYRMYRRACICLMVLFLSSLSVNILWAYQYLRASPGNTNETPTLYGKIYGPHLASAWITLKFTSWSKSEPGGLIHSR